MSLLTSLNSGSATQPYAIQNVSLDGTIPCVGTNGVGTVRVQANAGVANIQSDRPAAGTLRLGSDATSFQNIVLTTATTTINGTLSIPGAGDLFVGDDITLGGTLNFTNGAAGESISGYYTQTVGPLNCPTGADTIVPQPAGQTPGWYIIAASTVAGGQEQQQVSTLAYWNGVIYLLGGCNSNVAGAGRVAFNLNLAHNGIVYSNSTGAPQNGVSVAFTKLMN